MQPRTGLYKATFACEGVEPGGMYLDVAHGAGEWDCPDGAQVVLGVGVDYVGPLSPDELAFLTNLQDRAPAYLAGHSVPAAWVVTVKPAKVS